MTDDSRRWIWWVIALIALVNTIWCVSLAFRNAHDAPAIAVVNAASVVISALATWVFVRAARHGIR